MPQIQGINREQITFSNLESQIAKDNEIRFKDAFVEEFVSPVRSAKGRGMRGEVRIMMIAASYKDKMARATHSRLRVWILRSVVFVKLEP